MHKQKSVSSQEEKRRWQPVLSLANKGSTTCRVIRKVKDRALAQHDQNAEAEAELLNALLLMFVEPLILKDSIIVQESKI